MPQNNYTDKTKYSNNNKYPIHPNTYLKSGLDLELGGPINSPNNKHRQNYSPDKQYLKKYQNARSPNSNFGIDGTEILPNNIFKKTNLDVENPNPNGGPNRTNSYNIPTGQYLTPQNWNVNGWTFNSQEPGSALKDTKGNPVYTQLHQWTPKNKYMDSIIGTPKVPSPPPTPPPPSTPPVVPTSPAIQNLPTF